jgi:hypothetical protein
MAGALDHQAGIVVEATYGTPLTPTAFVEFDFDKSSHHWDPKIIVGTGMQPGDGGFQRADRSVAVLGQGSGTLALDYQTRGMGRLIDGVCGTGVSTLVAGSTFQQLFTSALTGSLLPPRTLEYGIVRTDTGGTVDGYRYGGVTFPKLTISNDAGDIVRASLDWDARSQVLGTAATASYPVLTTPFHYGQAVVTVGGTVVVPTTNALASGGTVVTNVQSFEAAIDNQADLDDWALGGIRNQPRIGERVGTIKMVARYDAATYDAALTNHTSLPVTITWTKTDEALSTGFATLQLVFPACKLQANDRPGPSLKSPTIPLDLNIYKPATGHAFYIVHRTADTTL